MARSKLSDVNFQSSVFKDTFQGEFFNRLSLLNSLMVEAPDDYISPDDDGYTVTLPKWNAMSGDLVQITTSTSTAYNSLADYKDIAVWIEREIAFQAEDILLTVAGNDKDVTKEVARQAGEFFANKLHGLGVSVLTGVFATALASSHAYDDSGVTINNAGLINAKLLLGDHGKDLTHLCAHSKVVADALKDRVANYIPKDSADEYLTGNLPVAMGMQVHEDDAYAAAASVYSSYLGAPGSLVYKFRNKPKASFTNANIIDLGNIFLELERDSNTAGGIDGMIFRFSAAVHCPGVQFDGTVTSNPTDTELETGSTWTKVAPTKAIKVVEYKSL